MKRFILWSIVTLIIALFLAGGIFFYIQSQLSPLPQSTPESDTSAEPAAQSDPVDESGNNSTVEEAPNPPLSETITEPIPLRTLPLSDSQRSLFETAGVDVETYEITPESIECAEEKIGAGRVRAIMEGDSPSFTEGIALSGCL